MYGLPPQPRRILNIDTEPAGIVLLVSVIAICGVAIAVLLAAVQWRERLGKVEQAVAGMPILCESPTRAGDRTVITLHHINGQISVRCNATSDWRHPERIAK